VEPAGVEVLEVLNDREDVSTAVSLVEAGLSAYPDVAGFYGVYAASTTGLARALETAGKTEEIIGVGVDTIKEHLQFLEKGALDARDPSEDRRQRWHRDAPSCPCYDRGPPGTGF